MNTRKVALVTGANRGIGLEVVNQLAKNGFLVILSCRSEQDGWEALESFGSPENIVFHQLDVDSQKSVDSIKAYVEFKYGRLDALINNAAINYDSWQHAINADIDTVKDTLETNLLGPWRLSQALVPVMQDNNFGRIVNVSSGAGALNGMLGGTPGYGISKAALNALTLKFADELKGFNILINCVCPGWVKTKMGGDAAPRTVEKGAETIVWAAQLPDGGPSGKFFRDKQVISF